MHDPEHPVEQFVPQAAVHELPHADKHNPVHAARHDFLAGFVLSTGSALNLSSSNPKFVYENSCGITPATFG